jgi:hypothetical protein
MCFHRVFLGKQHACNLIDTLQRKSQLRFLGSIRSLLEIKMFRRVMITAVFSILAPMLSATAVFGSWSGWYTPNFTGSYSPSGYRHGQWDDLLGGGTEAFGSEMTWNKTRADGVRQYSNNTQWIWFCGLCPAYYTHDHKDKSNRLSAYGYATNFPSPKIDTDDDDHNGNLEEFEITAVDKNFPQINSQYYINTLANYKKLKEGCEA